MDLLKNPPFRHIVLRLLPGAKDVCLGKRCETFRYHFSMDDRCKSLMAYHRVRSFTPLKVVRMA